MKVKKYVAASMPEAMKQIRAELGNDAVILNSKVVYTGGFLGFFRKKNIEVIAAMDKVSKPEPKIKEKQKNLPVKSVVPKIIGDKPAPHKQSKPVEEVINELNELKEMLKGISPANNEGIAYPEPIQHVNNHLIRQGIEPFIREDLMVSLIQKWFKEGSQGTSSDVKTWCQEFMNERISHYTYGELSFSKKYVNVVGPTGVGKTTTLAKIAADSILKFNKKVALITTDTYRIAAIEQLRTYAKILSIPLEVCYNLEDFQKACEEYKDYDVVLIDTAGRNFRNQYYVEELKQIINYDDEMETYLVLSLTAKQQDMEEIYKQFSGIEIKQFIFTKIDETGTYGSIYNLVDKYKKGVAYFTNGQNVPDDRVPASAEVLTNLILEEV